MTTVRWINKHLDFAVNKFCKDNDLEDFKLGLQTVVTRLEISPLEKEDKPASGHHDANNIAFQQNNKS